MIFLSDFRQGSMLIGAAFFLVLAAIQCYSMNHKKDTGDAPTICVIVSAALVLLCLFLPLKRTPEKQDEFDNKYDELSFEYEDLKESIASLKDDVIYLSYYIDGDEDTDTETARESCDHLYQVLFPDLL